MNMTRNIIEDRMNDLYCSVLDGNVNENYIQHSGGAVGADYEWARQGTPFGVVSRHYWHRCHTPFGNVEISEADFDEGVQRVLQANRTLHRRPGRYLDLLARNWCQVKYSDAIFAIGRIKNGVVQGGTAWAVQMALDVQKPVYLFDQASERWLTCRDDLWLPCDVPVLTRNFAGIGSRDISDAGIRAIGEVYRNTFKI
jgi:hypothetical protein